MTATVIQQVRPAGSRHEIWWVLLAAGVLVAALLLYVQTRGRENGKAPLYEWQVSAFDTLTGADQAIYNALYTAKDDIPYLYDDINLMNPPGQKFRWPGIKDLEEALLPPFQRDSSWQQNGSMHWILHEPLSEGEMQGSVMYVGTDGKNAGQGSFLLIIGHVHAGFTNNNVLVIWWNARNHVEVPESGFRDSLILQGWKEVVPHNGAAEVKRLFGDDPPEDAPADAPGAATGDQKNAEEIVDDLFKP